jgi:hypothetical protein
MIKERERVRDRERHTHREKNGKNTSLLRTILTSILLFSRVSHHQIALLYVILIVVKKKNEAEMRK